MSERPTMTPSGKAIDWFDEVGLIYEDGIVTGVTLLNDELFAASTAAVLWTLPFVYRALRAERQARTAADECLELSVSMLDRIWRLGGTGGMLDRQLWQETRETLNQIYARRMDTTKEADHA